MRDDPTRRRGGPFRRGAAAAVGFAVAVALSVSSAAVVTAQPDQAGQSVQPESAQAEFDVLVFSKTAGFRHDSIPDGIAAIEQLGAENGFSVTATEDATAFTEDNLAQYEAVVFLSTTGDVLNDEQQAAFESYIQSGGGYAGIHAASDTEYDWPWYGELVGAYFDSHPAVQEATVEVEDHAHPSTAHLPQEWVRTDEWYDYQDNPRGDVHVLASLDESSYDGGGMGADHPIAWCHDFDGGRAWYTGGGHTSESFTDEPEFIQHLLGGIRTAAGQAGADCGATVEASFDQITLAKGPEEMGEPMGVAVLPDGSALHTARSGAVYYTAAAGQTSLAAQVPVYDFREDGMQGIALDPDFEENGWVYLYYAPVLDTPEGEVVHSSLDPSVWEAYEGHNNLSRFTFADGQLDLESEQVILQVPQDRGNCCHHGGDIDFDADGNLYLSTGDDSDPFESNGYSPIDDRPDRAPQFDARRTSGNTNDLRGKILRIHVEDDGSYTIPEGNLFEPGTEKTRPEIYAMGFRNPFRISVDRQTGVVWVGDYGPDSGSANQYGPAGQVEFNRITEPGNFGWPYCTGMNTPEETYVEREFTAYYGEDPNTGEPDPNDGLNDPVGEKFDCANGPTNDSVLNTGLKTVPPAQPAWIPYDGGSVPEFGSGSESPMGGPVYHFDPELDSETKFPEYYDGKFFAYEYGRQWIKPISVNEDGSPGRIETFDFVENTQLMDLEFGPEGSLYVLDYGTGFFNGDENSALYRIDYATGTRSPEAIAAGEPTSGQAPLTVQFSSEGSNDPDPGDTITFAWDFDGDGTTDSTEPAPSHTYTENGEYTATLTVTDQDGHEGVATVHIVVGNTAPVVEFVQPANGSMFSFGDDVAYELSVTDPDGQPVDCADVEVMFALGHDQHTHGGETVYGCSGTVSTGTDASHGTDDNIFGLLLAEYTDTPPDSDTGPATGTAELVLQPKHRQAEHFSAQNGVQVVSHGDAEGGARVGYIDDGDWISFEPWNLAGIKSVGMRVSAGGPGGTVELRMGAPDGELAATVPVPHTGSPDNYVEVTPVPVTDPGGTGELFLVFRGDGGGLMDIDAMTFSSDEAACPAPGAEVDPNDEFDGTELDHCRWAAILRQDAEHYRVADGQLQIDALEGDMHNGNTSAANVILQDVAEPEAGFEVSTQFASPAGGDFEQAGVMVHAGDQNFAKAVLINLPDVGWRFEFGQDVDGTAVFDPELDRSGELPEGITENAHVKVVSDGHTLTAHWSADGEEWTQFGRTRSTASMTNPRIGLAAYNGEGQTVTFEHFHVTDGPPPQPCEPTEPEAGYRSLFDGTEASLENWRMAGPGGFHHIGCELLSFDGMGLYWYDEAFESYSLKLDWMMPGDDNSGVFVGFPDPGDDPWVAVDQGHEIQIDATDEPDRTTGAIYAFQGADEEARDAALNPPGEWNAYEIVVQGDRIQVILNGVLINDYTDTDPARMNPPSFIGLQNHGGSDEVYFRDVRIQEYTFNNATTLVADYFDQGVINRAQERKMTQHLAVAERLAGEGLTEQAAESLDRYVAVVEEVADEQVRDALLAMGEGLRAQL